MKTTLYFYTIALILVAPGISLADRTSKHDCPFSCATDNIPKSHCKDWREGNTCFVTDLRKDKKHEKQSNSVNSDHPANSDLGRVTANNCPYNCESARLAQRDCRDWRDGNTCYVEDLRRSSYSGLQPDTDGKVGDREYPTRLTFQQRGRTDSPVAYNYDDKYNNQHDNYGDRYCETVARRDVSAPRIEVSDVREGGFFSSDARIVGTVEGSCLTEAGYFERGRKVRDIPVSLSKDFSRYNFEIKARPEAGSELRAYNKFGDYDVFDLERAR